MPFFFVLARRLRSATDVTEEQAKVFAAPVGSSLRSLEGKRKQELEEMEEFVSG
jgi:hypothetical protein